MLLPRVVRRDVPPEHLVRARLRRSPSSAARCAVARGQADLVGLPVDRDELVGELPEHRHGGAPPADGRTAAALGRDGAGQDEFAVLDGAAGVVDALGDGVVVRDVPAAPRPRRSTHRGGPSSRRRARRAGGRARVTIIVLPAPVSPVTTVKPGPSSSVVSPMTPRSEIAISSITARPRRPAGGHATRRRGSWNFATSRSVNGASFSRATRTEVRATDGPRRRSARRQVVRPAAVAPQHADAARAPEHLDRERAVRADHDRPREQGVGAQAAP